MRIVSSPQEIPCITPPAHDDTRSGSAMGGMNVTVPGSYVKAIACGGRHSAVITGTDVSTLPCLVGSLLNVMHLRMSFHFIFLVLHF